jgi:bisphosphoglycerate-dependent phosphoglycerate mutase
MPVDSNQPPPRPWEEKLHEATTRIEDEVRRVVRYLDDEVVPDVRRSSSVALRAAAERLAQLAQRLDDKTRADADKGQK